MSKHKVAFILDRNYCFNQFLEPDTSFFIMRESYLRGMSVYAVTINNIFLNNNRPEAVANRVKFGSGIKQSDKNFVM